MLFDFFRRKKVLKPDVDDFPFFASRKELEGTKALPLLQAIEAELLLLDQRGESAWSETEKARHTDLLAQRQELLGSGQVVPELATHLVVSEREHTANTTASQGEWVQSSPRYHVLLIEDDRDLAEMLCFCLDRIAGQVTLIHDGSAALEWVKEHEPVDLISLDLMLPRTDGSQLLSWIRQQPGWEQVPIVVASSKSDETTVQRVLQAGADVYLTKPIQPDAYLAQVEKLLARA